MKLFSTIVFITIAFLSFAQETGTVRGFLKDRASKEPLIFTNVYLNQTNYGTTSDVNGFYTLSKIPVGTYDLIATGIGLDTAKIEITITAGGIITRNLELGEASTQLAQVDINVEKQEAQNQVQTSAVKITPKEISQIPSIGGQPEIAQYIQVLPGVVFTGDQGGQLYIRGGSPIQNKVLLDGLVIYNPFHSIGLFSVFDSDLIRNADVYTGGFAAEHGGRISSIMDITMKNGNKNKFGGRLSASPFLSKILLEGPLKKSTEESPSSISYVLSAKEGYLDRTSPSLYSYANGDDNLPFQFRDLYGKISVSGGSGSSFNVFGFNFSDRVDSYQAVDSLGWSSSGAGTKFILLPAGSPLLVEGKFGFSNFNTTMNETSGRSRYSRIGGFNGGLDFTYFSGDDEFQYGFEVAGFSTDFSFVNSIGRSISQNENTTEMGGYIKYKKKAGRWVFDPSLRIQYYATLGNTSVEPRLGVKFNINEDLRWKFAGGYYSQNLISATSQRDVVNLFQGFLSGSDDIPDEFNGEDLNGNQLQLARHIISGFEYNLEKFTFNLEGYYKIFDQLTSLNRNKMTEAESDFMIETGEAYGADFTMKYDHNRLYVWTVYSHGYVNRFDGDQTYWTHFDRRHNVNIVVSYQLGKQKDWEFNLRWNYGSAFPFTPTTGNIEMIGFQDGITSDFTTENGTHEFILGDINSKRLPDYHRLDINLKKSFEFKKGANLETNVGVTNLYNRDNIFYIDRSTNESVYQLPIMPNVGVVYIF